MNRSWVRFPQAAQIRPPGSGWAFLYALLVACCLLPRQISGRRAACPPARRPRRELRSARRLEARPGPAGLAAASNRSGRLFVARPGPATAHRHRGRSLWRPPHRRGLLLCVARLVPAGLAAVFNRSGCLCVAWPGPAAAHGHRSLALRSLRRPPHQWGWVADVCSARRLEAWPGPAAAHGRCGQALPTRRPGCLKPLSPLLAGTRVGLKPPLLLLARARVGLKPPSPLRAPAEPRLKPPSPLQVRNGRFW